jgi:hypothetical protein
MRWRRWGYQSRISSVHKYGQSKFSHDCAEARVLRKRVRQEQGEGDYAYKTYSCKYAQAQTNRAIRRWWKSKPAWDTLTAEQQNI